MCHCVCVCVCVCVCMCGCAVIGCYDVGCKYDATVLVNISLRHTLQYTTHHFTPHQNITYDSTLHYTTPRNTTLQYITPHHIALHHIALQHITPCHITLHYKATVLLSGEHAHNSSQRPLKIFLSEQIR